MQNTRPVTAGSVAVLSFPDLVPAQEFRDKRATLRDSFAAKPPVVQPSRLGHVRASVLSFQNMHQFGDLLVSFLRARKQVFIDRLQWELPETDGLEFDQYDTPLCRWIIIHEFGQVLGGIRLTPTTAKCGIYTYMLRDAQRGLLDRIPTDVLFFEAPVSRTIWEASRLFIADDVPAQRRHEVQMVLMETLARTGNELGAGHVIGIVPAVWSRWLRRLSLDAVPVGPKFSIDGTVSQAALFSTGLRRN